MKISFTVSILKVLVKKILIVISCFCSCNLSDTGIEANSDPSSDNSQSDLGRKNDTNVNPPDGLDFQTNCIPDNAAVFCAKQGKNCGAVKAENNCGVEHIENCGTCAFPQICGDDSICLCVPESDTEFCLRLLKNCGTVDSIDNCGVQRSIECGECADSDVCGGGEPNVSEPNVCGCPVPDIFGICAANNADCGSISVLSVCTNEEVTLNCGDCPLNSVCNSNACLGDEDNDGIPDGTDNCIDTPNPNQIDTDNDTVGDICDNCPVLSNTNQLDSNLNGIGDACEVTCRCFKPGCNEGDVCDHNGVLGQCFNEQCLPLL